MKKASLLFLKVLSTFSLLAQDNPASVFQLIDVAAYQNASFRIEGQLFIEEKAKHAGAGAMVVAFTEGKMIKTDFDRHGMESFKPKVWNRLSISGKIDKRTDKIGVGALFSGKGKFYFDDFKLFITRSEGEVEIPLANSDFEGASWSPWNVVFNDQSKIKLTPSKFNSGRQSLLIDNSIMVLESYGNNPKVGKYADINGIKLYYEIYGSGEPLLLLHGSNQSIVSFENQISEFSKKYKVIALDSRGQGNSSENKTKLSYELFADDVNEFLEYFNIKQANILGWSDGGNTALILALKHPDKVKKIAALGAVLYNDSTSVQNEINALLRKQIAEMEQRGVDSMDISYRLQKLLLTEPNINPEAIKQIVLPVLIMAGENDFIKQEHTKLIAEKIPNSTLKIFKKTGHDAPTDIPSEFNKTVLGFFNKKR